MGLFENYYYDNSTRGAFQSLSLTQARGPNNDVISSIINFILTENGITDRVPIDPNFCGMGCFAGLSMSFFKLKRKDY